MSFFVSFLHEIINKLDVNSKQIIRVFITLKICHKVMTLSTFEYDCNHMLSFCFENLSWAKRSARIPTTNIPEIITKI